MIMYRQTCAETLSKLQIPISYPFFYNTELIYFTKESQRCSYHRIQEPFWIQNIWVIRLQTLGIGRVGFGIWIETTVGFRTKEAGAIL